MALVQRSWFVFWRVKLQRRADKRQPTLGKAISWERGRLARIGSTVGTTGRKPGTITAPDPEARKARVSFGA